MKILNKRLKGSNLSYNGISIEFDSNGISSDLEDKVAKDLATLANYELVEEPKKRESKKEEPKKEEPKKEEPKKEEPKKEEPKKEEPKKEEPKKPAAKRSTARKTTTKIEDK